MFYSDVGGEGGYYVNKKIATQLSMIASCLQEIARLILNEKEGPPALREETNVEFNNLPWISFNSREPCKEDEAGWIYRNAAPRLASRLDASGKWTKIGPIMEYRLSGQDKRFINRRKAKNKG